MVDCLTLWDESLSSSGEDVALRALHLDASLLREGGPVMHLQDRGGHNGGRVNETYLCAQPH